MMLEIHKLQTSVKMKTGHNFEQFVCQFQISNPKILCIINGTFLQIYDNIHHLPKNLRLERKLSHGDDKLYHFRDIDDKLYCFFNDKGNMIYEQLVKNSNTKESIDNSKESKDISKEFKNLEIKVLYNVILIDKGIRLTFPNSNNKIEILSHDLI